jgi:cyanophycinase
VSQGPVMPIGGAEETEPGGEILERFVDLAGGSDARIAIIPTASDDPQRSGEGYAELFRKLGAKKADWLRVEQRSDANTEEPLSLLREATGMFITGGDQTRLVELLVGTLVMECIRTCNADGVVTAGTSAGASILSTLMMAGGTGVGGDSNGSAARKGMVDVVAGFGLLQDIIIDQHFSQRGRFGSNMVTIVDGRNTISDYFDREEGEVLTITGSSLHVLAGGRRFDVDARRAIGMDTQ